MKTWVRKSLNVGVLSAGFLLVAGSAAHASDGGPENIGLLNGNDINTAIAVPIDICGNAIGVLGSAEADCHGASSAPRIGESESAMSRSDNIGVLDGNDINTIVAVPIDVSGNAVGAILGGAHAVGTESAYVPAHSRESARAGHMNTARNLGLLDGNDINTLVTVPIDVCGNAIAVLGGASASCPGGGSAAPSGLGGLGLGSGHGAGYGSGSNFGLGNGNHINTFAAVPIDVCGNAIGVLSPAVAGCGGGGLGSGSGGVHGQHHHHMGTAVGGTGDTCGDTGGTDTGGTGTGYTPPSGGDTAPAGGGTGGDTGYTAPSGGGTGGDTGYTAPSGGGTGGDTYTPPSGGGTGGDTGYTAPTGGGTGGDTGYRAPSGGGTGGDTYTPPSGGGTGGDTYTPPSGGGGYTAPAGGGTGGDTGYTGGGAYAKPMTSIVSDATKLAGNTEARHLMARPVHRFVGGRNLGILNGNDINTVVVIPINVHGNALSILGTALAQG